VQIGETIFNERWAEIIGCSLAEISPTSTATWERFAHPDDLAESNRLLGRHFDGLSAFYECESRMLHKDGSWVWILDRGTVIERDAAGRPLWMYGTHIDITEKKAMEEQIRELAIRAPSPRCTTGATSSAASTASPRSTSAAEGTSASPSSI
jgi:PAS domain S-box-containing protein